MILVALGIFALIFCAWPISVSRFRRAQAGAMIIRTAIVLPIIFLAVELAMVMFGGGGGMSEQNFSGPADYMPTLVLIAYVAASIAVVVWAHRGRPQRESRGFPVSQKQSAASDGSDLL